MQEAQSWRDLLRQIIRDNKEKQRIFDTLNITPITLTRWINGESAPRPQNLRQLLNMFPQYREEFRALIWDEQAIDDTANHNTSSSIIPSDFYARILADHASISKYVRFWHTCKLILQQAIDQLDPEHYGMSIWVVQCMPPSGPYHKVRSLRERIGLGTLPWTGNLEQNAMFLGAESLAGSVVTHCRPSIVQDLEETHPLKPTLLTDYEKSAAIYPILYTGNVAGALLVSSTIPNYFLPASRCALIQQYADLLALAFSSSDFYPPEEIALGVMPSQKEQKKHFAAFGHLVAQAMMTATTNRDPINNLQADLLAWQKLEEELLNGPTLNTITS